MTTTLPMVESIEKGLQVGDSVKRWRAGIAGGLAAVVLGFAGWTGYQYVSPSQNTTASVKAASEPRWLGRYAEMRKRYDRQIEEGRKYITEKYGIADTTVAVFDKVHHCEQGIMSPPCPIQEGMFAAYAHPSGYIGLIMGDNGRIMEYKTFMFPDDLKKREALKFFREQAGLEDVMVSDIIRISETETNFEVPEKKSEEDYLFRIDLISGWENFRGIPKHGTYILDLRKKTIEYQMTL